MAKPWVALAIIAVTLAAIFVAGGSLQSYANMMDAPHFNGTALPPCFINSTACGGHILGTDEIGRDLLSRLIVGARSSLGLSFVGALCEFCILGLFVFGTRRGATVARLTIAPLADGISCYAAWPVVMVIASITFGESSLWRLATLSLAAGTVLAARAMTPGFDAPVTCRLAGSVIRDWATILLLLATIDFFGMGVQPPTPSWGNMLAKLQMLLQTSWWVAVFPAAFLFTAAVLLQLLGRAAISSGQP
ncbi:MAG TPA: hypothetical protein VGX91_09020 [Candidatus Cybelea sp.]|jgi:ABC-type dipeptide/oligopeptide/nickel transport system permease subunit|nr:hypothetical protein [Candidatus Cybelea sp.]